MDAKALTGLFSEAAADRRPCRVGRPGDVLVPGMVCGLGDRGIVVDLPGHLLRVGEEVRLRLESNGVPVHFEASVIAVGSAVPDRSADGVLLGFLHFLPNESVQDGIAVVDLLPSAGGRIPLLDPPVTIVDLAVSRLEFEVPRSFRVILAEGAAVRLRFGAEGQRCEVVGRVDRRLPGERYLLYSIALHEVDDQAAYRKVVPALRNLLGR